MPRSNLRSFPGGRLSRVLAALKIAGLVLLAAGFAPLAAQEGGDGAASLVERMANPSATPAAREEAFHKLEELSVQAERYPEELPAWLAPLLERDEAELRLRAARLIMIPLLKLEVRCSVSVLEACADLAAHMADDLFDQVAAALDECRPAIDAAVTVVPPGGEISLGDARSTLFGSKLPAVDTLGIEARWSVNLRDGFFGLRKQTGSHTWFYLLMPEADATLLALLLNDASLAEIRTATAWNAQQYRAFARYLLQLRETGMLTWEASAEPFDGEPISRLAVDLVMPERAEPATKLWGFWGE